MPKSVLLVDDDPTILWLLSDYLQSEGLRCVTATSIDEGLQLYTSIKPDLVIAGIAMETRECGYQLLQQIRSQDARQPFIFLSGQLSVPAQQQYALSLNVDACFAKPFEPAELLAAVTDAV